jgi:glycosyltransferase involved in cell wall biosynthesis
VWDRGVDDCDSVIRRLAVDDPWIRPIWFSRNFGQHAATLAGMTSTGGDWIVTMDEDGQHDPSFIGQMLDVAYDERSQLVYASPSTRPPHGFVRNAASRTAKWVFSNVLTNGTFGDFHSYRLILGEAGRSVAAYCGPDVFLDVALSWVISSPSTCRVAMRAEGRPASNYSYRRLASHFWRMVLSSGTRPLRIVSLIGVLFAFLGLLVSLYSLVRRLQGDVAVQGWTSVFVAVLLVGGTVLLALGIIAEYVAASASMSMGKPTYVIVSDPEEVFGTAEPE